MLDGVCHETLDRHEDPRGSFTEMFASHWMTGIEPSQWSVVRSEPGALRGMHLHLRHDEFLSVVAGTLWVGLHDLRPESPTFGSGQVVRLSGDVPSRLSFPRGLVHGWVAETPTMHLQAVSESYVDYAADDNLMCRWDDPDLGVDWPIQPVLLSDRSVVAGSLSELRSLVAEHRAALQAAVADAGVR